MEPIHPEYKSLDVVRLQVTVTLAGHDHRQRELITRISNAPKSNKIGGMGLKLVYGSFDLYKPFLDLLHEARDALPGSAESDCIRSKFATEFFRRKRSALNDLHAAATAEKNEVQGKFDELSEQKQRLFEECLGIEDEERFQGFYLNDQQIIILWILSLLSAPEESRVYQAASALVEALREEPALPDPDS